MTATRGQLQVQFLRSVRGSGGRIVEAHFVVNQGKVWRTEPVYLLTLEQQGVRSLQELPWSSQLEQYLLTEIKVRMTSQDEEAERFANILRNNLFTEDMSDRGGFERAVFVTVLRDRPEYMLGDLLDRIGMSVPNKGEDYESCAALIQHSLDGLQNSARLELAYTGSEALEMMRQALRIVLEEMFLSATELLFP